MASGTCQALCHPRACSALPPLHTVAPPHPTGPSSNVPSSRGPSWVALDNQALEPCHVPPCCIIANFSGPWSPGCWADTSLTRTRAVGTPHHHHSLPDSHQTGLMRSNKAGSSAAAGPFFLRHIPQTGCYCSSELSALSASGSGGCYGSTGLHWGEAPPPSQACTAQHSERKVWAAESRRTLR